MRSIYEMACIMQQISEDLFAHWNKLYDEKGRYELRFSDCSSDVHAASSDASRLSEQLLAIDTKLKELDR